MNAQARLGAFFILALLVLGMFSSKIGRFHWVEEEGQIVEAVFPDAAGVIEQTPVLMAGVKIGLVEAVQLEANEALVKMRIQTDIALPNSTRARIEGGGLIGEKFIALSATPGDTSHLDGQRIPTDSSGNVTEILKKTATITEDVHRVFNKIEVVTRTISQILQESRAPLQRGLEGFDKSSTGIATLIDHHHQDMEQFFKVLPEVTRSGQRFFDESTATLREAHAILTDNRENLYRTLFELRKASENLEALSDDLRYNPWKMLVEKPEVKRDHHAEQKKMEEMILTTGRMGPVTQER